MSSCDGVPLPWPLSSWSNVKEWIVGAVLQLVALQSVSIFSSGAIGEAPGGPPGAGDTMVLYLEAPVYSKWVCLKIEYPQNFIKFHGVSCISSFSHIFPIHIF